MKMSNTINMSAPNSARGYRKYNIDSHTTGIPSLTPIRQTSLSLRNTYSPKSPSAPQTPTSPRKRTQSFNLPKKIETNKTLERIKNMIDTIDRNDDNDMIYSKSPNCCIFSDDIENLGYHETKFVKREYISPSSDDRQLYLPLMRLFEDSIKGVSERFPEYYYSENRKENQMKGITTELDMWFSLFDECIFHESTRSKMTAFILQNISEVFRSHFSNLIEQVKNSCEKVMQIEENHRKSFDDDSLLPPLKTKIEQLKNEIERQKREYNSLKKENARYHFENFELKSEVRRSNENVRQLLKTSDVLVGRISQSERRIYELSLKQNVLPLDQTMGAVPDDVLKVWDQSSQFLRDILNDTLDSYDLNTIMPEYMFSPEIETYISMPKLEDYPRDLNRIFHFTQLYKSIKYCSGDTDPNNFFNTLELKVRNLFKKFGSFYYHRIEWARQTQIEHISQLNQYNKEIRKKMPDNSIIIKTLLENAEMFNYPKNLPDILPKINEIFQQVPLLMKQKAKPRSAADVVAQTLKGSDLILFLMIISRQAQTDIYIDVFKKFILNELPFYVFVFLAKMNVELENSDMKTRSNFMSSTFNHVGFNSIPLKIRKSFDASYTSTLPTFEIFMMALYQYSIEKVAPKLKDKINSKDIEKSAAVYFKLNELQALDVFQYMAAISPTVKPSEVEFAVCAFDRKVPFDDLISDFKPSDSKLIDYMNNFGKEPVVEKSKKSKKKKATSKSRSSKSRPSSAKSKQDKHNPAPLLIGNVIALDESIEKLVFEDGFGEKIDLDHQLQISKPEMAETGIDGDGLQDVISIRIDANKGFENENNNRNEDDLNNETISSNKNEDDLNNDTLDNNKNEEEELNNETINSNKNEEEELKNEVLNEKFDDVEEEENEVNQSTVLDQVEKDEEEEEISQGSVDTNLNENGEFDGENANDETEEDVIENKIGDDEDEQQNE